MLGNASHDIKKLARGLFRVMQEGSSGKRKHASANMIPGISANASDGEPQQGLATSRSWFDRSWLEKAEQVLLPLPASAMVRDLTAHCQRRDQTRGGARREKIFEHYDKDNDGVLSFCELKCLAADLRQEFHPEARALSEEELNKKVEEILLQIEVHQDGCVGRWNGTVEVEQFQSWLQDQELKYLQCQPRPRHCNTLTKTHGSQHLRFDALRTRMNFSRWRRMTMGLMPALSTGQVGATSMSRRGTLVRSRSHDNLLHSSAPGQKGSRSLVKSVSCEDIVSSRETHTSLAPGSEPWSIFSTQDVLRPSVASTSTQHQQRVVTTASGVTSRRGGASFALLDDNTGKKRSDANAHDWLNTCQACHVEGFNLATRIDAAGAQSKNSGQLLACSAPSLDTMHFRGTPADQSAEIERSWRPQYSTHPAHRGGIEPSSRCWSSHATASVSLHHPSSRLAG